MHWGKCFLKNIVLCHEWNFDWALLHPTTEFKFYLVKITTVAISSSYCFQESILKFLRSLDRKQHSSFLTQKFENYLATSLCTQTLAFWPLWSLSSKSSAWNSLEVLPQIYSPICVLRFKTSPLLVARILPNVCRSWCAAQFLIIQILLIG